MSYQPQPMNPTFPTYAEPRPISLAELSNSVEKNLFEQSERSLGDVFQSTGKLFQDNVFRALCVFLQPPNHYFPPSEQQNAIVRDVLDFMFVNLERELFRAEEAGINGLLDKTSEAANAPIRTNEYIDYTVKGFYQDASKIREEKYGLFFNEMMRTFQIVTQSLPYFIQTPNQQDAIFKRSMEGFWSFMEAQISVLTQELFQAFRRIEDWFSEYAKWIRSGKPKRRPSSAIRHLSPAHKGAVGREKELIPLAPSPEQMDARGIKIIGGLRPVPFSGKIYEDLYKELLFILQHEDAGDHAYDKKESSPVATVNTMGSGEWGEHLVYHIMKQCFAGHVKHCFILNSVQGKGTHFDILLHLDIGYYLLEVKSTINSDFRDPGELSLMQEYWARRFKEHFVLVSVKRSLQDNPEIRIWQNPLNTPKPPE